MFRVSERAVRRLTVQGILKLARNSKRQAIPGRYELDDAVGRYADHLRQAVADDPDAQRYQAARARTSAGSVRPLREADRQIQQQQPVAAG